MTTKFSEANVPTEHAVSYMKQLCRHWGHKFPVTFDDQQGRIELPETICSLQASADHLQVRLEVAEGADEQQKQRVVAEHLQRFGFREPLAFDWHEVALAAN